MIPGFSYTIPTIGRIAIGQIVEHGDKRLPKKLDHFVVTGNVKSNGSFVEHPLASSLKKDGSKLREIPVRVVFSHPDLIFREHFEAFDGNRQVCVSTKAGKARRRANGTVAECDCPGPDACEFGMAFRCKPFGRLNVQIDGQDDLLSTFILRTRGWNSVRTLRSKLEYLRAMFGKRLSFLPLKLSIRAKSSTASRNTPFYFVDIGLRDSSVDGIKRALEEQKGQSDAFCAGNEKALEDLENAAFRLIRNGAFEETEEDDSEFEDLLISDSGFGDDESGVGGEAGAAPATSRGDRRNSRGRRSQEGVSFPGLDVLREGGSAESMTEGAPA